MPLTPFHFGPGLALHAAAPRHVGFVAFCATNVVIDVESLHNLVLRRHPVHAFFHSYVGAALVAATVVVGFVAVRWLARRLGRAGGTGARRTSARAVAIGAALGAASHVALDSVMHADIRPLAPFSAANALLGVVPLDVLHAGCAILGVVGLAGVGLRRAVARDEDRDRRSDREGG